MRTGQCGGWWCRLRSAWALKTPVSGSDSLRQRNLPRGEHLSRAGPGAAGEWRRCPQAGPCRGHRGCTPWMKQFRGCAGHMNIHFPSSPLHMGDPARQRTGSGKAQAQLAPPFLLPSAVPGGAQPGRGRRSQVASHPVFPLRGCAPSRQQACCHGNSDSPHPPRSAGAHPVALRSARQQWQQLWSGPRPLRPAAEPVPRRWRALSPSTAPKGPQHPPGRRPKELGPQPSGPLGLPTR